MASFPKDTILMSWDRHEAFNFLDKFNSDFVERHCLTLQRFVKDGRCDGIFVSPSFLADLKNSKPRFSLVTENML